MKTEDQLNTEWLSHMTAVNCFCALANDRKK